MYKICTKYCEFSNERLSLVEGIRLFVSCDWVDGGIRGVDLRGLLRISSRVAVANPEGDETPSKGLPRNRDKAASLFGTFQQGAHQQGTAADIGA